jgi:tetratricopeptide (TPR) repeat protein
MSKDILQKIVLPGVVIVVALVAAVGLNASLEHNRPQLDTGYGDSDLNFTPSSLKGYLFGAEGLAADWYFMRSLQYIGDKMIASQDKDINLDDLRSLNPRLLYPLLDNATSLDPHFIAAYSYGAIVLPAIDPEKAIDLVTKGIANNPTSWRLHQHLGYIYWKIGRYDKASESYEKGSQIAGAPPFMRLMAASMKTEGGSRETSRSIYREMLAGAEDEMVAITAQRRLKELDSLDEREAIDRVLTEFKEKNGRCANNFGEITSMLMTVKLPEGRSFRIDASNRIVDPTDAPYLLDKENCRVKLDPALTGLPID